MARIKFGAIVVDGSGKLGGHVFSKNRGGNYMRTKVTPVNPRTPAQTAVRAIFTAITTGWSSLTQNQRQSWQDKSSFFARTNVFGDLKEPTGKALYQRLNMNLLNSDQAQIDVAPNPISLPSPQVAGASAAIGLSTFGFETTNDLTGNKIVVLATEPVSPGTTFVKNKLRRILVEDGGVALFYGNMAAYNDKFGLLVAGDVVYIGISVVNSAGQSSPVQSYRVLVQA